MISTIFGSWVNKVAKSDLNSKRITIVNTQKTKDSAIETLTYFTAFNGLLLPSELPIIAHTAYDIPRGKLYMM